MSCTQESVLWSIEVNPSFSFTGFSRHSLLAKAVLTSPLVQSTMGNLMKIYCVARSISSFRLAEEATRYIEGQLRTGNQMLPLDCEVQFESTKPIALFDYGRKLVAELIEQNAPESLQDSELMKVLKSALGVTDCEKCSDVEGAFSFTWNDKDSIPNALWHVAEERWREATEKLLLYKPENVFHSAVEVRFLIFTVPFNNIRTPNFNPS